MSASTLADIEAKVDTLSVDEQLRLLEHVARNLRKGTSMHDAAPDDQLAAMSSDPAIRRELDEIQREFSATEADGLGDA